MCYRSGDYGDSYLILNPFPNDFGHLITIDVNDRILNLDFSETPKASFLNVRKHLNYCKVVTELL